MIATFSDIIALWPTAEAFAADVSVSGVLARQWRRRNNIPSAHWVRVVEAARARGFADVTLELLAGIAAQGGRLAAKDAA